MFLQPVGVCAHIWVSKFIVFLTSPFLLLSSRKYIAALDEFAELGDEELKILKTRV